MRPPPARSTGQTRSNTPAVGLARLAAVVRSLRLEYGFGTRALARRAAVDRKTVQRLERGRLRPRRSLLVALGTGLDPDRTREILAALIEAAGDEGTLAHDGRWQHYRSRRIEQGWATGQVPLPAEIARKLVLNQRADELWAASIAIFDAPALSMTWTRWPSVSACTTPR